MIAGFGAGSWYLYMVHDRNGVAATAYRLMAPWIGLDHLRFGIVGMAASLVAMVVVTLATRAADAEITPGFLVEPMVPLFVAWFFLLFRFYLMPWLLGYSVRGMLSFPLESDIARALHALFSRGGGSQGVGVGRGSGRRRPPRRAPAPRRTRR